MTYYRLGTKGEVYDNFDLPYRIHHPIVVAIRDGKYIGFLATLYTVANELCLYGANKLPASTTGRVWFKMLHKWEAELKRQRYGGYLIWVYKDLDHWNTLLARVRDFTIIGETQGRIWYKRIFTEA